jgi:hypothetical protein
MEIGVETAIMAEMVITEEINPNLTDLRTKSPKHKIFMFGTFLFNGFDKAIAYSIKFF